MKTFLKNLNYYFSLSVLKTALFFRKFNCCNEACEKIIAIATHGKVSGACQRKDYSLAISFLKPYKEIEDDYCSGTLKYYLGILYYHGHGVSKNETLAEKYFIQSANLGDENAIKNLTEKSKYEEKH